MIIAGIIIGVLAVHFLGGSKASILATDDDVIERFHQDYPESRITTIIYTADRRSAFFAMLDDFNSSVVKTGLVHGIGAKFLTRIFEKHAFIEVKEQGDTSLYLRMDDFGWPAVSFTFNDTVARNKVCNWLNDTNENGSSDDE